MPSAKPPDSLESLLFDVVPAMMQHLRRRMRVSSRADLSIPQWRLLAHVYRGVSTSSALAEQQGVSLAAISKMADALQARGLLQRDHKAGNRKQLFFRVTAQGAALYRKNRREAQRLLAADLARASPRARAEMKRGLVALRELFGHDSLQFFNPSP
jgi:DNA-binding MarR family transcriptional regulator